MEGIPLLESLLNRLSVQEIEGYLRKSRNDLEAEARGEDVFAHHAAELARTLENHGFPDFPAERIHREIYTGDSLTRRREFMGILERVDTGETKAIAVVDIDRLGRGNMTQVGAILDVIIRKGCLIVTPYKMFDPANDDQDLEQLELKLFVGRLELRQIKRRLVRGLQAAARDGKWVAGDPPYGWRRRPDGGLERHPEEWPWKRRAWDMWLEGHSDYDIAATFDREGAPLRARKRAARWHHTIFPKWRASKVDLGFVKLSGQWHKGLHYEDRIITEEEAALASQRTRPYGAKADNPYLLKVYGAGTNNRLYGQTDHRRKDGERGQPYRYYRLKGYPCINADDLEGLAFQALLRMRDDQEFLEMYLGAYKAMAEPHSNRIGETVVSLQQALSSRQAALAENAERLMTPGLSSAVRGIYEQNVTRLDAEVKRLTKELAEARAQHANIQAEQDAIIRAREALEHIEQLWPTLSNRRKKHLLEMYIPRVDVARDGAVVFHGLFREDFATLAPTLKIRGQSTKRLSRRSVPVGLRAGYDIAPEELSQGR